MRPPFLLGKGFFINIFQIPFPQGLLEPGFPGGINPLPNNFGAAAKGYPMGIGRHHRSVFVRQLHRREPFAGLHQSLDMGWGRAAAAPQGRYPFQRNFFHDSRKFLRLYKEGGFPIHHRWKPRVRVQHNGQGTDFP